MLLEASAALALVLLAVSLARAPFWPALALAAPAALVVIASASVVAAVLHRALDRRATA